MGEEKIIESEAQVDSKNERPTKSGFRDGWIMYELPGVRITRDGHLLPGKNSPNVDQYLKEK